jgi:hypothetical protein
MKSDYPGMDAPPVHLFRLDLLPVQQEVCFFYPKVMQ